MEGGVSRNWFLASTGPWCTASHPPDLYIHNTQLNPYFLIRYLEMWELHIKPINSFIVTHTLNIFLTVGKQYDTSESILHQLIPKLQMHQLLSGANIPVSGDNVPRFERRVVTSKLLHLGQARVTKL